MAKQFTRQQCVDYLVRRRFPRSYLLNAMPFGGTIMAQPDTGELRLAVNAFKDELAALTPEELDARFNEEKGKELEQLRARAEQEERQRFYNQSNAKADFAHWAKAAHWTLDEAIALSFGKAPEVVQWEKLQNLTELRWPFVTEYVRRRDLALRAKAWEQLYDPVLPGIFLAWAKQTDIDVPPELIEEIEKRGVQVADWKSLYEDATTALKVAQEQTADWKQLAEQAHAARVAGHARWLEIAEGKNREIAELQEHIALFNKLLSERSDVPPRETES